MRNFQDTFETSKRSFINDFSICMTVPLTMKTLLVAIQKTFLMRICSSPLNVLSYFFHAFISLGTSTKAGLEKVRAPQSKFRKTLCAE